MEMLEEPEVAIEARLLEYLNNQKPKRKIHHSIIKLTAIIFGGITIGLGCLLFLKGVTGNASLSIDTSKISGQLLNATPGLFFAVLGSAIIVVAILKKETIHVTVKSSNTDETKSIISREFNLEIPTFLRKKLD